MSTHNICFHGEIRKYQHFSDEKSALSVAMQLPIVLEVGTIALGKRGSRINIFILSPYLRKVRHIDFVVDPIGVGIGIGVTISCPHNIL